MVVLNLGQTVLLVIPGPDPDSGPGSCSGIVSRVGYVDHPRRVVVPVTVEFTECVLEREALHA